MLNWPEKNSCLTIFDLYRRQTFIPHTISVHSVFWGDIWRRRIPKGINSLTCACQSGLTDPSFFFSLSLSLFRPSSFLYVTCKLISPTQQLPSDPTDYFTVSKHQQSLDQRILCSLKSLINDLRDLKIVKMFGRAIVLYARSYIRVGSHTVKEKAL